MSVGGPPASASMWIRTSSLQRRAARPRRGTRSPCAVPDSVPALEASAESSREGAPLVAPVLELSVASSKPSSVAQHHVALEAARSTAWLVLALVGADRAPCPARPSRTYGKVDLDAAQASSSPSCEPTISLALTSIRRLSSRKRRKVISPTVVPLPGGGALASAAGLGAGRSRLQATAALTTATSASSPCRTALAGSRLTRSTRELTRPFYSRGRVRPVRLGRLSARALRGCALRRGFDGLHELAPRPAHVAELLVALVGQPLARDLRAAPGAAATAPRRRS